MTRRENWPVLLANFLEVRRTAPFQWGVNDCCAFAAAWVLECTDVDLFAPWAGYTTAAEALRHLEDAGGIRALWGGLMGSPLGALYAQRGDLVLIAIEGRESIGVCDGLMSAGPGPDGLAWVKTAEATCAWRI